jgi:hypothetical protein
MRSEEPIMLVKAVFWKDGQRIGEYSIMVVEEGDLQNGAKEAKDAFRKHYPAISLFDVTVSYEKLEGDNARRSTPLT